MVQKFSHTLHAILFTFLVLTTFIATAKASECIIKGPCRVGKNKVGGPEKQVILFVWP